MALIFSMEGSIDCDLVLLNGLNRTNVFSYFFQPQADEKVSKTSFCAILSRS